MAVQYGYSYKIKNATSGQYLSVYNDPNHNTVVHGRSIVAIPNYDEAFQKWHIYRTRTGITIQSDIDQYFALDMGGESNHCMASQLTDSFISRKLILEPINSKENKYRIKTTTNKYLICDLNQGLAYVGWVNRSEIFSSLNNYARAIFVLERTNSSGADYTYPTESRKMTLPFAMPWYGLGYVNSEHSGIDIAPINPGSLSETVSAFANGTVSKIKYNTDDDGYCVYINHGMLLEPGVYVQSRYLHLNSAPAFNIGQYVSKGQLIGTMGDSGNASYVHLHFELVAKTKASKYGAQGDFSLNPTSPYAEVSYWVDPKLYLINYVGSAGYVPPNNSTNIVMARYTQLTNIVGSEIEVDNIPDSQIGSGVENNCRMHPGSLLSDNLNFVESAQGQAILQVLRVFANRVFGPGHNLTDEQLTYYIYGEYYSLHGVYHNGVDINYSDGAIIYSLYDGVVVYVDETEHGVVSIYNQALGVVFNYIHLKNISVDEGAIVYSGDEIGEQGSVGTSDSHLHFEVVPYNGNVEAAERNYSVNDPMNAIPPYGYMNGIV